MILWFYDFDVNLFELSREAIPHHMLYYSSTVSRHQLRRPPAPVTLLPIGVPPNTPVYSHGPRLSFLT